MSGSKKIGYCKQILHRTTWTTFDLFLNRRKLWQVCKYMQILHLWHILFIYFNVTLVKKPHVKYWSSGKWDSWTSSSKPSVVLISWIIYKNCIEIYFIYHTIHTFNIHSSMVFSILIVMQPSPVNVRAFSPLQKDTLHFLAVTPHSSKLHPPFQP